MKVNIELEIEISISENKEHKHPTTNLLLLEAVSNKVGTHITNMYIDDIIIKKTKIL